MTTLHVKRVATIKRRIKVRDEQRVIDRYHKCETCPDVFYCQPCSRAATACARSGDGNSKDINAVLYAANTPHRFVCPDCRRRHRTAKGKHMPGRPQRIEG